MFINSSIVILVYSINDKEKSFKIIEQWHNMLLKNSDDYIIIWIGNKSDLEKERKVKLKDAETFKNNYHDIN